MIVGVPGDGERSVWMFMDRNITYFELKYRPVSSFKRMTA